jgi:hypothetical protein
MLLEKFVVIFAKNNMTGLKSNYIPNTDTQGDSERLLGCQNRTHGGGNSGS